MENFFIVNQKHPAICWSKHKKKYLKAIRRVFPVLDIFNSQGVVQYTRSSTHHYNSAKPSQNCLKIDTEGKRLFGIDWENTFFSKKKN